MVRWILRLNRLDRELHRVFFLAAFTGFFIVCIAEYVLLKQKEPPWLAVPLAFVGIVFVYFTLASGAAMIGIGAGADEDEYEDESEYAQPAQTVQVVEQVSAGYKVRPLTDDGIKLFTELELLLRLWLVQGIKKFDELNAQWEQRLGYGLPYKRYTALMETLEGARIIINNGQGAERTLADDITAFKKPLDRLNAAFAHLNAWEDTDIRGSLVQYNTPAHSPTESVSVSEVA